MLANDPDLTLLKDAAVASGEIAQRYFKQSPDIWDKDHGAGPVTEADIEIDRMLRHELLAARPNYGWLSEETEDRPDRRDNARVFIVDPIDGTRAFIAGERHFSHSLAIAEKGVVIAAAVYLPMLDQMFLARRNGGATLNGGTIQVSAATKLAGATMLAAKPNLFSEHWEGGTPPVVRKFRPSLAYRLCLVAQGRYDSMLTLRDCWEWDIAAGMLVIEEAGGRTTDRTGGALRFNSVSAKTPGCLGASKVLHKGILDRLKNR